MEKCDICGKDDVVTNKVHDKRGDDSVKNICDECLGHPEYLVRCPHCDADIGVN
jgi:hypothetical protein